MDEGTQWARSCGQKTNWVAYLLQRTRDAAKAGSRTLFAIGFGVASVGLVALALISVSEYGIDESQGRTLYALLAANGALIVLLSILVAQRVARKIMGRRFGEPTPKLHIRFIWLFAVAAIAPAILMAGFHALVLGRGMEFWFGERVNTLVNTVGQVAQEQAQARLFTPATQLQQMADDLSQAEAMAAVTDNPVQFSEYLQRQIIIRGFPAAYVIDGRSTILSRAESTDAPPFQAPSTDLFSLLEETTIGVSDPVIRDDELDYVRMLIALGEGTDRYLYVLWYSNFGDLLNADIATASYRQAIAREEQRRQVFLIIYIEAAFLILVGAIWLALTAANQIVQPVGQLVGAAERVRRGDLDAKVAVNRDHDELAALGRAFNRMTRQLRNQHSALLEVNAEAERRRAFIEAVLSGVSAGVIGVDEKGQTTLVNRSAANLLNLDPDEVVGEPILNAAPILTPLIEDAERRDEPEERQIDVFSEDGAIINLNVRLSRDDDDGLVITFDDVTRLVAAQRNAAWRDVARRIAHEIKNPLTPIQLSAERLRRKYRDGVPEDQLDTFDRCVETIVRQVSDIGRMVDEFSSFARMPAPKMERTDIAEIAQSAVFAQRVASPQLHIELEQDSDPIWVECDSRLATQALANLLKNAAESVSTRMEQDGAKTNGEINVIAESRNGYGIIEVTDNGLGWPTPDKSRLTEPYMTTREKGTGLGLAIVRRVMEDHKGRLELDDRSDGQAGAIVRLAFPLLEEGQNRTNPAHSAEA